MKRRQRSSPAMRAEQQQRQVHTNRIRRPSAGPHKAAQPRACRRPERSTQLMSALALAITIALAACKSENREERREILATVSGSPIYVDELERELKRFHGGNDDDEAG